MDVEIYLIVIPAAVILGINLFFYIAIVARVVCCRRNLTASQVTMVLIAYLFSVLCSPEHIVVLTGKFWYRTVHVYNDVQK